MLSSYNLFWAVICYSTLNIEFSFLFQISALSYRSLVVPCEAALAAAQYHVPALPRAPFPSQNTVYH